MSIRKDLERRARDAILQRVMQTYLERGGEPGAEQGLRNQIFSSAIFSISNAIIIAAIILATGFAAILLPLFVPALAGMGFLWPVTAALGGLVAFAVAEGAFFYRALTNEQNHSSAVAEMLAPQVDFEPSRIRDKELTSKLEQALEYWALIDDSIKKTPKGVLRDRLERTEEEVTHWLEAIYNLAKRVDQFRQNTIVERDLKAVPAAIRDNERKLKLETNPQVVAQLEKTIADQERQLQTLENLDSNMSRATYQLDSTVSSLGTIYSQLLLVGSKGDEGSELNRLQKEISEQVYQLEDLTEAMDEVYSSSAR